MHKTMQTNSLGRKATGANAHEQGVMLQVRRDWLHITFDNLIRWRSLVEIALKTGHPMGKSWGELGGPVFRDEITSMI